MISSGAENLEWDHERLLWDNGLKLDAGQGRERDAEADPDEMKLFRLRRHLSGDNQA